MVSFNNRPASVLLSFIVRLSFVRTQTPNVVYDCKLSCPDDVQCINGTVNHVSTVFDENASTTSWNGIHCDCPVGTTGLTCEVNYDSCGSDSEHKCYNDGVCLSGQLDYFGNEQLFCDCTSAVDIKQGIEYKGKYCEHAILMERTIDDSISDDTNAESSVQTVNCMDDPASFCLGRGKCNEQYPSFGAPCLCSEGYSGPYCEYEVGTVPNCTLVCQNGGHCVLGPDKDDEGTTSKFWKSFDLSDGKNDFEYMHCSCPNNFAGPLCNIEREPCSIDTDDSVLYDQFCYHGSQCKQTSVENEIFKNVCDCSAANTEQRAYAGLNCQYEAESFCSEDASLFCVNGGTCRSGEDVSSGCECPSGYKGLKCEDAIDGSIPSTQLNIDEEIGFATQNEDTWGIGDCNLKCVNGECRAGVGNVSNELSQITQNTQHLFFDDQDTEFSHCVCSGQNEWTGPFCDVPVESCGNGQHLCLHGGKCVHDGEDQLCDCDDSNADIATFFAGQNCEHSVHDICTLDANPIQGLPLSFCVNRGICKSKVNAGQQHPGCYCETGFIGPHCELREATQVKGVTLPQSWLSENSVSRIRDYNERSRNGRKSPGQIILLFFLSLALVAICGALFVAYKRYRMRRSQALNSSLIWVDKFRDYSSDDNEVNIAPMKGSTFSDIYPTTNSRDTSIQSPSESTDSYVSSRDPMASHLVASKLIVALTSSEIQPSDIRQKNAGDCDGKDRGENADNYEAEFVEGKDGLLKPKASSGGDRSPQVYIGPPRDEDGHVLHSVDIV